MVPVSQVLFRFFFIVLMFSLAFTYDKTFGEYKAILKDLKLCKGKYPPEVKPSFDFNHEIVVRNGTSYSVGFLTIKGDTRKYKTSYTCYSQINGKLVKRFEMSNMNCHSLFGSLVMACLKVPYDRKTCSMAKGTYPYEIDIDGIHHKFLPEWEYGALTLKFEITRGKRTVTCIQTILSIVPKIK